VKAHVHRSISEAVACELWPDTDCRVLVGASVTMDAVKTVPRHQPASTTDNTGCIQDWARAAREEYLEAGLSVQCQIHLGNVFHLVQDGFISSQRQETHNDLEGQVSRYVAQFTCCGIDGESVTTEYGLNDFLRRQVGPIEDPQQILARAFRVCLFVGRAVTSPRADFQPGVRANDLITEAERLIQEVESEVKKWMDAEPAKTSKLRDNYFSVQISEMKAASLEVADRVSVFQRITGSYKRETGRYENEMERLQKQKAKLLSDSAARNEYCLKGLLELAGRAASVVHKLKATLGAGYQPQYELAQSNARWLGICAQDFPTPSELEWLIRMHEERVCSLAPTLGSIARQAAISVDLISLETLDSYPVFRAELGSQAKTEETPEWIIEQPKPIRVSPAEKPDNVELREPGGARRTTSSPLSKGRLAVLGGLAAAVVVVFSCLAAVILLTQA
jgi:hypothetical protein